MPQRKAKKRWERGRLARLARPILSRRRRAIAGWGGGTPGGSATTPGSLYFQWWRGIRHGVYADPALLLVTSPRTGLPLGGQYGVFPLGTPIQPSTFASRPIPSRAGSRPFRATRVP